MLKQLGIFKPFKKKGDPEREVLAKKLFKIKPSNFKTYFRMTYMNVELISFEDIWR